MALTEPAAWPEPPDGPDLRVVHEQAFTVPVEPDGSVHPMWDIDFSVPCKQWCPSVKSPACSFCGPPRHVAAAEQAYAEQYPGSDDPMGRWC